MAESDHNLLSSSSVSGRLFFPLILYDNGITSVNGQRAETNHPQNKHTPNPLSWCCFGK
ncbi:14427_t:CDS:1, partial [Dentiscutata heterogama]